MSLHFGDNISPQSQSLGGQQQNLQMQQKLLTMTQELRILKRGGPEAEALIQKKIAEGRPPPDLEQFLILAQQQGVNPNAQI